MTPARLEELRQMAAAVDGPKSTWMDELIEEIDRLRGPFTCNHPPEHAGSACAVCHAEWIDKAEKLELKIQDLTRYKEMLLRIENEDCRWASAIRDFLEKKDGA